MEDAAIQAKADAKAKKWEAGEPQRAEHRAQQEAEDAAYAATLPQHVEDLTEEHVTAMMNKGKGDPKWFLTQDMAKKYINQYNATDTVGRKTSAPVKPKILQALHNTAIYGTPPASSRQVLDKVHAAGDAVDVMTGFPAGDLSMLGEAAVTGNKPMAAMAGAGLALPGAAGVAAKSSLGKKLGDKTLSLLERKASNPQTRQRLAQGIQDRTGVVDERVTVGETYERSPTLGDEDIEGLIKTSPYNADVEALKRRRVVLWEDAKQATINYKEDQLKGINEILYTDALDADISIRPESRANIDRVAEEFGLPQNEALWMVFQDGKLEILMDGDPEILDMDTLKMWLPRDKAQILEDSRVDLYKAQTGLKRFQEEYDDIVQAKDVAGRKYNYGKDHIPPGQSIYTPGELSTRRAEELDPDLQERLQDRMDKSMIDEEGVTFPTGPATSGRNLLSLAIDKGFYDASPAIKSIATKLSQNPVLNDVSIINAAHTGTHIGGWRLKPKHAWLDEGYRVEGGQDIVVMHPFVNQDKYPETLVHELSHAITVDMLRRGYRDLDLPAKDLPRESLVARRFFLEIDEIARQVESSVLAKQGKIYPGQIRKYRDRKSKEAFLRPQAGTDHTMLGVRYQYGGTNPGEFIAEAMSNIKFRQTLKDTPYIHPGEEVITMWDKVSEIIANILGLSKIEADALFASMDSMQSATANIKNTKHIPTEMGKSNFTPSDAWLEAQRKLHAGDE